MDPARPVDVLIVSLGSTQGLRAADEQLRESIARAGAHAQIVSAHTPPPVRTLMLTDLAWARAARLAASTALARRSGGAAACAVVYSSTTAALLWPRPGAIRFDATAAANRPGRHGLWQRPLERRRLTQAPLLLPWSEGGLAEAPARARGAGRALVLPVAVQPSGPPAPVRDVAAITYAANPRKKGLDRVLAAWRTVRPRTPRSDGGDELLVAGVSADELTSTGMPAEWLEGVRAVGSLPTREYRALLRRARVFVSAPRREDYGIAQLEALADGCLLVTSPAPGPYVALSVARALDARLVDDDLATALRIALDDPPADYAPRAAAAIAAFGPAAIDRTVADELLPRLLTG
jgi:hypothetical protein